jgi:hypothetical protein
MLIIHHRRNSTELLRSTSTGWGVEVDVRTYYGRVVVQHDPYKSGEEFDSWLKEYSHKLLVVNTKEEGLESQLLRLLKSNKVTEFFFLDQSFPCLVKTAQSGESRCAVRVSEYESIDTALALSSFVRWVWIDIFTRFPLNQKDYKRLRETELKLCLVSPELQGHPQEKIGDIKKEMADYGMSMDAVCTKQPELWLGN